MENKGIYEIMDELKKQAKVLERDKDFLKNIFPNQNKPSTEKKSWFDNILKYYKPSIEKQGTSGEKPQVFEEVSTLQNPKSKQLIDDMKGQNIDLETKKEEKEVHKHRKHKEHKHKKYHKDVSDGSGLAEVMKSEMEIINLDEPLSLHSLEVSKGPLSIKDLTKEEKPLRFKVSQKDYEPKQSKTQSVQEPRFGGYRRINKPRQRNFLLTESGDIKYIN